MTNKIIDYKIQINLLERIIKKIGKPAKKKEFYRIQFNPDHSNVDYFNLGREEIISFLKRSLEEIKELE